jgi:hypothetical protein
VNAMSTPFPILHLIHVRRNRSIAADGRHPNVLVLSSAAHAEFREAMLPHTQYMVSDARYHDTPETYEGMVIAVIPNERRRVVEVTRSDALDP